MEEKLIEAMKAHPCLFDKSSLLFRNKYLKDRAWQAVAASTGVSEEHCKSRWKSLRDRFVREMSASKLKSGAAAEEKMEWCYMEAMRFLTKHVSPRKTISNFQWNSDEQQSSSQDPVVCQNKDAMANEHLELSELHNSQCSEETSSSMKSTKRQRLGNESRERFERLCGTIEAVVAAKTENVPSKNSAFLQMLDECLQKKSEELQDRLKIELLAYVHNAD